jgi:hypothetical protein
MFFFNNPQELKVFKANQDTGVRQYVLLNCNPINGTFLNDITLKEYVLENA